MEGKERAFSQFKMRMETKYGTLTDHQTHSVFTKLVTKQLVNQKDLKEAEEEIKLLKTPDKLSQARSKYNAYKTIEEALKLSTKTKQREANNSITLRIQKEPIFRDNHKESMRTMGSRSEMKHRANSKSFGNEYKFKFPKLGASDAGSIFGNHKNSYISSIANRTTSDPFNKSVIVYSDNYLTSHNKNLEEEKQKIRLHQLQEKKRLLAFLTRQANEKSKREIDDVINNK